MFFAILNAGFIYRLIWLFERKRRELLKFDFDKIAVIPPFIYLGLSLLVVVPGRLRWLRKTSAGHRSIHLRPSVIGPAAATCAGEREGRARGDRRLGRRRRASVDVLRPWARITTGL
jgi:hypothetical protein